ncbi:MAG: hypothetical protein DRO39_00130 [Thermoprotei archaeon]|nr:MAG: hypothetical protein DRO39_00130 [Thermoprotei archaeon]
MAKARLRKVIGGYVTVTLPPENAIELIEKLRERLGRGGEDVEDALRIIRNFDTFYEFMRKKFKEFLYPKKSVSDMIKGNVIVDKVKLIKNGEKLVTIVFDRSVEDRVVEETIRDMGLDLVVEE